MGELDSDDVVSAARRFAARAVAPILDRDGPDGDLARLPGLAHDAVAAGLLASPDDRAAASLALWGAELGARHSLDVLFELGRVCAGSGMALAVCALASRLRSHVGLEPSTPTVVALPLSPRCPPLAVLEDPRAEAGAWVPQTISGGGLAEGFAHAWAFSAGGDAGLELLAFVRAPAGWSLVRSRDDARLVDRVDDRRIGLRACPLYRVNAGPARFETLADGAEAKALLHAHLARTWLVLGTLAAATASSAVRAAARYAGERFQGGVTIGSHAAVQELLGEAAARAASARSAIESAAETTLVPRAAQARLTATADAAVAVTQSLQTFGGNGYMEDFRVEKRLRDVEALRATLGTPIDLRRIVAAAELDAERAS